MSKPKGQEVKSRLGEGAEAAGILSLSPQRPQQGSVAFRRKYKQSRHVRGRGKSCLEAGACHVHCLHSLAVTLRILIFNLTGIRRL